MYDGKSESIIREEQFWMITDNIICYVPYIYNTYYFTGIGSHLATIILI